MKFIFLIAAFNALFFSILLFQKKPRALHDIILILWLIYLGLFIGIYSLYSHDLFTHFHLLSSSLISLFLLQGGFLYIYVSTLVRYKTIFKRKDIIHITPFLLFNLYLLIASFFPDISDSITLDTVHLENKHPFLFILFLIVTALSGPFYFALSIKILKKHDINVFNNFSFSEVINLDWLRKLIYVFGIVWTSLIIITVIHHVFNLFSMVFCTDGLFLSLSAFIILIGYFGLKQKEIFTTDSTKEQFFISETKMKYSSSLLTDKEADQYIELLSKHMVSSKPFLNSDLTLPQLASEIGISSHYLSQIINEKFNVNFFDFINHYRIEEVKEKIIVPKFENYSLLGIAFDCGFNSKSAFNRIFKKFTDQTPSQFKSASNKL
jgi:AraC-like DNA-binding protein